MTKHAANLLARYVGTLSKYGRFHDECQPAEARVARVRFILADQPDAFKFCHKCGARLCHPANSR